MSKYIPRKGILKNKPVEWSWSNYTPNTEYQIFGRNKEDLEKEKEHYISLVSEKDRIESIPLEDLSFKDLYEFPFRQSKHSSWVYDAKGNFIFQFEFYNETTREKTIQILNEELTDYKRQYVEAKNGEIFVNGELFITIRGWGNLTGVGAYNLDGEYAAKIQDTLSEYIVNKLSKIHGGKKE